MIKAEDLNAKLALVGDFILVTVRAAQCGFNLNKIMKKAQTGTGPAF